MTATQTQLRRDTAANLNAATPASGEPGWDTTNKRLVVGDGTTAGGIRCTMAKDLQNQTFIAGTVAGSGNAITLTNSPVVAAYAANQRFTFKASAGNTGATTVNVDGLGAKNILKMQGGSLTALSSGDIVSGGVYDIFYDGTQFQIKGLDETVTTGGTILQIAESLSGATAAGSTTIPYDNTIPQNTEGNEFTSAALAFTPESASSTLIIDVWAYVSCLSSAVTMIAGLFVDSTASALAAGAHDTSAADEIVLIQFSYKVASASTSARTYKLRYGGDAGSGFRINGSGGAAKLGAVMKSGIRVTEVLV